MRHPNKRPFRGVLGFVDKPSDKAPAGARGHLVLLTKTAVKRALPYLCGMGINFSESATHRPEGKQGIIEEADLIDGAIVVRGYIFEKDCGRVIEKISASADEWGMSYEAMDCHVDDLRTKVWVISELIFTGAAIIPKEKAAYSGTSFALIYD